MIRFLAPLFVVALWTAPASADFYALRDYARMGNLWGVVLELANGTSPDRPDYEDGYTPLMFAAGNGHAAMTRLLIKAGPEIDVRDHNGDRALLWAAQRGHAETVALLLAAGAAPQSPDDPYGQTPLMEASRYGHVAVARLLLDAGADPDARDQTLSTALQGAVLAQSPELVALLLESGADADLADEILLETPLFLAAQREETEVLQLLLAAGAGLEAHDDDGQTPLYAAAMQGHAANVAALLAAGADPNATPPNSAETPLIAAMTPVNRGYGDPEATALLLAPVTGDIDTAFATAIWSGFPAVADILLARGASPDAVDEYGRPALAGAAWHDGLAMFDKLLASGASIAVSGPGALLAAAHSGRNDIVQRLLDLGVPVDVRSEAGTTPFLEAVSSGAVETVRLLLAEGADPKAADSFGRTVADYIRAPQQILEAVIHMRQASRAWRPTDDLELELTDLTARHAEIAALLGLVLY